MLSVTAQYLGGHPEALDPARAVRLAVTDKELVCERPAFTIAAASIVNATVRDGTPPAVDYKASPFLGLFGGLRAQPETQTKVMTRAKDRHIVVSYVDSAGRQHDVSFAGVQVKSRSKAEFRADMAAGDWNGAARLAHYLLSNRT